MYYQFQYKQALKAFQAGKGTDNTICEDPIIKTNKQTWGLLQDEMQ